MRLFNWLVLYLAGVFCLIIPCSHAQQCDIIYVSANGATSGLAGTQQRPAELNYALSLLTPQTKYVFLENGLYELNNTFPIQDNLNLEGGFNASDWSKTNNSETIIIRKAVNLIQNPLRLIGFQAQNAQKFRIQDIHLIVEDLTQLGQSASAYGIHLQKCSNYVINRCIIETKSAGDGGLSDSGRNGQNGGHGLLGNKGEEDGACCREGGNGGNNWSNGLASGGKGGNGGLQGEPPVVFPPSTGKAFSGDKGENGKNSNGGDAGSGGAGNVTVVSTGCDNDGTKGMDGGKGQNGRDGRGRTQSPTDYDGESGLAIHSNGFFQPGSGKDGKDGENGGGGGGGGGGGSQGGQVNKGNNGTGAGGGGGGEGGEAGKGGKGGGGGGGTFAIYLFQNGDNGVIKYTLLSTGKPGKGAKGGNGGIGGIGGRGGFGGAQGIEGQPVACDIGRGGDGGAGGRGGDGGRGGLGTDGEAKKLFIASGGIAPKIDSMDLKSNEEPLLTIKYSGCSEQTLALEHSSSGEIFWFFGLDATPASASGNKVYVRYKTPGLKTINVIANGVPYTFSDYLNIRQNGKELNPQIIASRDTICEGGGIRFQSTLDASIYRWKFSHLPNPFEGEQYKEIENIKFLSTGSYIITLQTYSACCGWSDEVSIPLYVRPGKGPNVSIAPVNGKTNLCQFEDWSASASFENAGINPLFVWKKNNNIIPNSGGVIERNDWQDGDVLQVGMVCFTDCAKGDTVFSNKLTLKVAGAPKIVMTGNQCIQFTSSATKFQPNTPITCALSLENDSTEKYIWDFGNGTFGAGRSTTTQYAKSGNYTVLVRRVSADGCQSQPCIATIFIEYRTVADFEVQQGLGCTPLKAHFINRSANAIAFEWNFGDGSAINNEANPIHIYKSAGKYTVMLKATGANNQDSIIQKDIIVANPNVIADFVALETFIANTRDSVKFVSNARGATQWKWDFGDTQTLGDTSRLANPIYFYSQEGKYTISLEVENEFGCKDTTIKKDYIVKRIDKTATEKILEQSFMNLYPNPAQNTIYLKFLNTFNVSGGYLELYNLAAKQIKVFEIKPVGNEQVFSLEDIPQGFYLCKINLENGKTYFHKILIQR